VTVFALIETTFKQRLEGRMDANCVAFQVPLILTLICYQASPACPSDKSSTTLKISLQVGGMILSRQNRSTGRHTSPSATLPTTKDRNGGSATSGQWATARLQDKYKKSLKSKSYIIQNTDHDHHTPNGHCWIEKQPLFSVKVIGNALLAGWKISKYWRVWCA